MRDVRAQKSLVKGTAGERKAQDVDSLLYKGTQGVVASRNPPTGARVNVTVCSQTYTVRVSCSRIFHTSASISHRIGPTCNERRFFSAALGMSEAHRRVKKQSKREKI